MASSPQTVLEKADIDTLKEINREAEALLSAQLSTALAADGRAMSFASVLGAGATVIGGGGVVLVIGEGPSTLGWIALCMTVGLLAGMFLAMYSARPVRFSLPGMNPRLWTDDITEGKSLGLSLAELATNYSEELDHNNAVMKTNGHVMSGAIWTTWGTLAVGVIVGVGVLICSG